MYSNGIPLGGRRWGLKRRGEKIWSGFMWLRIGSRCGNLWTWYLAFGFCQKGNLLTSRATVSLSRKPCLYWSWLIYLPRFLIREEFAKVECFLRYFRPCAHMEQCDSTGGTFLKFRVWNSLPKFISTSWFWLKWDHKNGELRTPVWLIVMVPAGCVVCQVWTETQEAVSNGNTLSSMMGCNLLGFDVPTFTRNGSWSTVNQLQGCGEIVLCVLCKTWIGTFQVVVCFLLGNYPASELYMPTFWNTLFYLHKQVGVKND